MADAVERFYANTHRIQREANPDWEPKCSADIHLELMETGHRYSCVAQYLRAHRGLSVVELGFGSAEIALALSEYAARYRIVDIVAPREEIALPENVAFIKANINDDFPFRDAEFDCTVAMMVIEHLFDPFHSFGEISRITKHGGKVFVNLPNIASIRCRAQLACGRMPVTSSRNWFETKEWDGNHLHYFTIKDTLRLARQYGLTCDAIFPVGKWLWLKRISPSLLCHEISFAFSRV